MSSSSWESDTEEIEVIKKPAKQISNSDKDEEASTDAESDAEQESEENASGDLEEDTSSEEEEDAFATIDLNTEENIAIKKRSKTLLHLDSDEEASIVASTESDAEQESEENGREDFVGDTSSEEGIFSRKEYSNEIRIASWNLQGLKKEKCNTHFLQIICNTIISNGLGIVAIQEVVDKDTVKSICDKLNENHGGWEYKISERAGQGSCGFEYLAYLFNKNLGIQILNDPALLQLRKYSTPLSFYVCETNEVSLNENSIFTKKHIIRNLETTDRTILQLFQLEDGLDDSYKAIRNIVFEELKTQNKEKLNVRVFTRDPFLASFMIGDEVFNLIGVHLKAVNRGTGKAALKRTRTEAESLLILLDLYKDKFDGRNIIILGDFNIPYTDESFEGLRKRKYERCISSNTNISKENTGGSRSHDNIWLSKKICLSYNEQNRKSSVIRENLACRTCRTYVSDHCPVYVELKK